MERLAGPTNSVIRVLSEADARNVAKAADPLLRWTNSKKNHALTRRSLELMRTAIETLKTALPATDPELIGGVFANLLDLWETGQRLDQELQTMKKLRLPKQREALRSILQWIDAIQLDMASYWIKEIKRDLPKLLKALDRLERRSVHDSVRKPQRSSARQAR